jgi:hypothetical protein
LTFLLSGLTFDLLRSASICFDLLRSASRTSFVSGFPYQETGLPRQSLLVGAVSVVVVVALTADGVPASPRQLEAQEMSRLIGGETLQFYCCIHKPECDGVAVACMDPGAPDGGQPVYMNCQSKKLVLLNTSNNRKDCSLPPGFANENHSCTRSDDTHHCTEIDNCHWTFTENPTCVADENPTTQVSSPNSCTQSAACRQ